VKLKEAIKGFLIVRALDLSPNTVDIYRWALALMSDYLGDVEVTTINTADLNRFFLYLKVEYQPKRAGGKPGPLTPRSIENAWTAMRSFFNWCERELDLTKRPDKTIRRPQYKKEPIQPFTETEVLAILKACERTRVAKTADRRAFTMKRATAARDVALISILLDTGIRASECSRLDVEDVNIETGEVRVAAWGTGKKSKGRYVYIGKACRKAIWRYLAERDHPAPDDPLFLSLNDQRLQRDAILHVIDEAGERAGVKNCHPHRFRHTMAVFFLRNGGNVFTLQEILGHSTLNMVQEYVALSQSDVINAHRQASPMDRLKK